MILTLSYLTLMLTMQVNAKGQDKFKIDLISGKILTVYDVENYVVEYKKTDNSITAKIYLKGNSIIVEEISETTELSIDEINKLKASENECVYGSTFTINKKLDKSFLQPKALTIVNVQMRYTGNEMKIDRLYDCSHIADLNGKYVLSGTNTYDLTGIYPTTKLNLRLTGVIGTESSCFNNDGFELFFLRLFNYKILQSDGNNWYADKGYNYQLLLDIVE